MPSTSPIRTSSTSISSCRSGNGAYRHSTPAMYRAAPSSVALPDANVCPCDSSLLRPPCGWRQAASAEETLADAMADATKRGAGLVCSSRTLPSSSSSTSPSPSWKNPRLDRSGAVTECKMLIAGAAAPTICCMYL
ncbi:hypothetical protein BDZ89DRAFT_577578 [Hymenopellis radicata]|nr:hypothetical protein BDZ89DRAFT_577578 [Hymenopellis radicata]